MTTPGQNADERSSLLHFLERWQEGTEWQLLEETTHAEMPDFLLQRIDGSETVGVAMRRAVVEPMARATAVTDEITEELLDALQASHVEHLGVFLLFNERSALTIGKGQEREAVVMRVARLIKERLPLETSIAIEPEDLAAVEVHAVDFIVLFPKGNLEVFNAGSTARGRGVHVVQPYIDEKAERLPTYRSDGATRSVALCPSARFAGVWLVLILMDGPGLSSSISSRRAEHELKRRGFDRAFLLDYGETGRRVIELLG